jgi:hypothetical protein
LVLQENEDIAINVRSKATALVFIGKDLMLPSSKLENYLIKKK